MLKFKESLLWPFLTDSLARRPRDCAHQGSPSYTSFSNHPRNLESQKFSLKWLWLAPGTRAMVPQFCPPKGKLLYWHSLCPEDVLFLKWSEQSLDVWAEMFMMVQDGAGWERRDQRTLLGSTHGTAMFPRRTFKNPNTLTWTSPLRWLGRYMCQKKTIKFIYESASAIYL